MKKAKTIIVELDVMESYWRLVVMQILVQTLHIGLETLKLLVIFMKILNWQKKHN